MNDDLFAPEKKNIKSLFADVIPDTHWIYDRIQSTKINAQSKHAHLHRTLMNFVNKKGNQVTSKTIRQLFFDGKSVTPHPVRDLSVQLKKKSHIERI